jgi:hypothetical protein
MDGAAALDVVSALSEQYFFIPPTDVLLTNTMFDQRILVHME